MTPPVRAEVRWLDSAISERWVSPEDVKGRRAGACISVGYIVDENEQAITIAQSVGEGEDGVEEYGQPLTIPRAALCGEPVALAPALVRNIEVGPQC